MSRLPLGIPEAIPHYAPAWPISRLKAKRAAKRGVNNDSPQQICCKGTQAFCDSLGRRKLRASQEKNCRENDTDYVHVTGVEHFQIVSLKLSISVLILFPPN